MKILGFRRKKKALAKLEELEDPNLHLFGYDLFPKKGEKRHELWPYKRLYNYIISEKDPNYYEFFEADYKVKLFVDIDCEFAKHPECIDYTIDELIERTIKILTKKLDKYGYSFVPIITLNATTVEKLSSHLIFPTVVFENIRVMNNFMDETFKDISDNVLKTVIDLGVYKTGCLRLMHCSKKGKTNKLRLYKTYNYTKYKDKDVFLDCLVTNVQDIKPINFTIQQIVKKQIDNNIKKQDENKDLKNNNILNERYKNEIIMELLGILSSDRIDNRSKWINLGILIYCLELDCKIWDQMSRMSYKYKEGECEKIWNNFRSDKKYTIKTLYYWAKSDNSEEYFKIIKKHEQINTNDILATHINSRYLLDLDKKLNDNTILCDQIEKFFNLTNNYVSLNIHSPYDTAKTTLIKAIIEHHKPQRVLWVSYRKTLTYDILGNFKQFGFVSYLDRYYFADKIIIQVESLLKIDSDEDSNVPYYDLIIIDEIESILNQFSSNDTFHGLAKETFNYLDAIIKTSIKKNGKIMSFDGDMDLRSYQFLGNYGKTLNIVNDINFNDKTLIINPNRCQFEDSLYSKLDQDKKIVLVSMTEKDALHYSTAFKKRYPDKIIGIYTGKTSDSIKKHLEKVNDEWLLCDIVIYTPTIEAGVNFDIVHFNNIFGIISDGSCSQRAYFQMLARVRKITDSNIIILNSTSMKLNNCCLWNYDEVKNALIENQDIHMTRKYEPIGDNIKTVMKIDFFDELFIFNKVEELNKTKYYFLYLFDKIARKKGFKIKYIDKIKEDNINDLDPKIMINKILETQDITELEYQNLLKKQFNNNASEEEKYLIDRHHFCKVLGVEKLNEQIMEKYYKKTGIINNFASLIDIKNLKKANDPSDLLKIRKIEIINNLLKELGFKSVMDKILIQKETMSAKIDELILNNNFFNSNKEKNILFPSSKDRLKTFKSCICYMNSIFSNYGFNLVLEQLTQKKISKKNKVNYYKIELLNGIDEIIKFRIALGYHFNDNNNLLMIDKQFINDNVVLWKDLAAKSIVQNDKIVIKKKDTLPINIILELDEFTDADLNYDYDKLHDDYTQNNNNITDVL